MQSGWVCPLCQRVNGPQVDTCPCGPIASGPLCCHDYLSTTAGDVCQKCGQSKDPKCWTLIIDGQTRPIVRFQF